jgi:outer membrane protein insertion porin family
MRCRPAKAAIFALLSAFLIIAVCAHARAQGVSDVKVEVVGNRHVGADAIRTFFGGGTAGRSDAEALDRGLKSLYATGLFEDVKISHDGDRVIVTVVENPTIVRLAFEGNKKIKDADLNKGLQSKPNGPLWRAFVQGDVERIIAAYRAHGYFETQVTPATINARNGRVDLVFTVKEGAKLGVRQILFAGNNAFAANKLTGAIKTGQTN